MKRKIYLFCLVFSMLCLSASSSFAQAGKSEFSAGYGYLSIYTMVNGTPFKYSSGSSTFSYRYYLTRDVTLGLGIGYENISNWGSFVNIAPELTGTYLDTRNKTRCRVRIYGSISYGIALFKDLNVQAGQSDESGPKPWAFQATPFGIRVGRQIAGYAEIGVGYKGLINGGLSVRFPRRGVRHTVHAKSGE